LVPARYYDNEDIGVSRETSHPNFVALAPEDFYYDATDDFGPFGSDDGNDTLSGLEEWYQDGGKDAKVMGYLKELLDGWDFGLPKNVLSAEPEILEAWLAQDDMNERYLQGECRARMATAFGQLKIAGIVIPKCRDEALEAIRLQLWMNERAVTKYPDWAHGTQERSKLLIMQLALQKL
jgi:uncharacterized protein YfeS